MTLVRWTPAHSMMNKRWNTMFNEMMGMDDSEERFNPNWVPRVDISENESEYKVVADLPGMDKKDVNISLENDVLTINGRRETKQEENGENYHLSERVYGNFNRSFNLHNKVDQEKIKAEFINGELTIHLPKVEKIKPRKIEIKTN